MTQTLYMEQNRKGTDDKVKLNRQKFDWLLNPTEVGVQKYFDEFIKAYYSHHPDEGIDDRNPSWGSIPVGQEEDRLFLHLLYKNPNCNKLLKEYNYEVDYLYDNKLKEITRWFEMKQQRLFDDDRYSVNDFLVLISEIKEVISEMKEKINLFDLFVNHFFDVTRIRGNRTYKWKWVFSEGARTYSVWRAIYWGCLFPERKEEWVSGQKMFISGPYFMEREAEFDPNEPGLLRCINACNSLYYKYLNNFRILSEHVDSFKKVSINELSIKYLSSQNKLVEKIKLEIKEEQNRIDLKKHEEQILRTSNAGKLISLSQFAIKYGTVGSAESGVYLIVNNKTGDYYIGESQNMIFRKKTHIGDLTLGEHPSKLMQEHFNKFGVKVFEFYCLETFELDDENVRKYAEKRWIKEYNPTYNNELE